MKLTSWNPALALALFVACAGAHAQAPAASGAQPSSPAKKALAMRIIKVQQSSIEQLASNLAAEPARQLMQQAGMAIQGLPPEKRDAAARAIQADVKKYAEDAEPAMKSKAFALAQQVLPAMLEERFTEDELKQVAAWLESPTSKKFGQAGLEMSKALTEKLVADMRPAIEPKLKALQSSMEKDLGIAPAPAAAASGAKKK